MPETKEKQEIKTISNYDEYTQVFIDIIQNAIDKETINKAQTSIDTIIKATYKHEQIPYLEVLHDARDQIIEQEIKKGNPDRLYIELIYEITDVNKYYLN